MTESDIREICPEEHPLAAQVYNANPRFLLEHLGVSQVDEGFIAAEVSSMSKAGFHSCIIVNAETQAVQGVLDYRDGKEAYLSLLMLEKSAQGQGFGREIYLRFEAEMRRAGSQSIRIDVVNDHPDSALGFWRRLGFSERESIVLRWGKKASGAVVMRKYLEDDGREP